MWEFFENYQYDSYHHILFCLFSRIFFKLYLIYAYIQVCEFFDNNKGKGIRFIVLYPPKCSHNLPPLAGLYTRKPFQSPGGYSIICMTAIYIYPNLFIFRSFVHLGAGLSVGLSGLASGFAIGIVGDSGVRGTAQQPRLYVGMILILIFAEVLGLYGLIVALIMYAK